MDKQAVHAMRRQWCGVSRNGRGVVVEVAMYGACPKNIPISVTRIRSDAGGGLDMIISMGRYISEQKHVPKRSSSLGGDRGLQRKRASEDPKQGKT